MGTLTSLSKDTTMDAMTTPPERPSAPEHLTTGWEPDLPVADTLLRRFVFALAESWAAPVRAMGGRTTRHAAFVAADLGRPSGVWNSATLLQPLPPGDPERIGEVLRAIEGFYDGQGTGGVALWSAWPTPDLSARGWTLEGHPPMLVRPAGLPLPPAPRAGEGSLHITRITDAAGVRDWERVAVDGFPFRDLQPLVPGALLDGRALADPRCRLWVGYEDGPVVCGSVFLEHGLSLFGLGVTLPEARRRGHWAAMVSHRLRAAPHLPAAALFSDMSRPGAERVFGFLPITRFTLWTRSREPAGA
jgi:hypothetical protein